MVPTLQSGSYHRRSSGVVYTVGGAAQTGHDWTNLTGTWLACIGDRGLGSTAVLGSFDHYLGHSIVLV